MRLPFNYPLLAAVCLASLLGGCAPAKVDVHGLVTFDGVPVEDGTISFAPVDGQGPSEGAHIESGQYTASLTVGPKKVEVRGSKKVGEAPHDPRDPSSPLRPVFEEIVPAKYYRDSKLTADIKPGQTELNFPLTAD